MTRGPEHLPREVKRIESHGLGITSGRLNVVAIREIGEPSLQDGTMAIGSQERLGRHEIHLRVVEAVRPVQYLRMRMQNVQKQIRVKATLIVLANGITLRIFDIELVQQRFVLYESFRTRFACQGPGHLAGDKIG